ncbi:MAG TPA: hypothetical protein ENN53_03820 [Candidatus Acetothermia bacterium]|nr:hypothetical protein [Candidatus Acetothermia bacterium]
MRRILVLAAMLALGGVLACGQYLYAFYYDRSGGQDLEMNFLCTMPSPAQVRVSVYDAYGTQLWTRSQTLAPYGGAFVQLGRYVPAGDAHWGVATVESDVPLVIGLEYLLDGELVSIDHISQTVPELDPEESYWLGGYWTQVGDAATGIVVMNPWNDAVAYYITIYRQDGVVLYEEELGLGPHESTFYDLDGTFGHGAYLWGLVDVEMAGKAVVVAVEYYGRGLEVDNITQYYY